MKRAFLASACVLAFSTYANAQQAVGVGVGVSKSSSRSDSKAVAISGQGGTGQAAATGVGSVTVSNPVNPAVTTSNQVLSGTQTIKNVPSVFAPGLAAAGLETCLGSVSGGGSFVGTGFSFGSTIPDPGCAARLDARTLWSMGLKKAAVARLCLNPDINRSMPEVCGTYLPGAAPGSVGYYESSYSGGPIMLVEGKTGQDRLCNNYDSVKQRCRAWAGVVSQPRKKIAAVTTRAAQPAPTITTEHTEGSPR